jgi:uncharacterized membrane protein
MQAQNKRSALLKINDISYHYSKKTLMICALFLSLLICLMWSALCPAQAQAKDYTMPQTDITAQAMNDGSLHVVERRTFDFSGTYSAVWWTFDQLPDGANIKVNSAQIGYASSGTDPSSVTESAIPSVGFNLDWRDKGGPGKDSYSVDDGKQTVYVFLDADDSEAVVTLDYTVTNASVAYKDCADLYWQYVASAWQEDSENVTCTLTLPAPNGSKADVGQNVYAWGHGPLDGTVAFNDAGTALTCKTDLVKAGQFAEVHVLYPVSWLSGISSDALKAHGSENHLDDVKQDEKTWADSANYQRMFALWYLIALAVIALLIVAWGILMFLRHGKEYKPQFIQDYWRDVPEKGVHPAVIGRLCRWDKDSGDYLTATIMHLAQRGALTIHTVVPEGKKKSKRTDYSVVRVPAVADAIDDPIDKAALDLLFGTLSNNSNELQLSSIKTYGSDNPEAFNDAMTAWNGIVVAEMNKQDYFEVQGSHYQLVVAAVSGIVALAAFGLGFLFDDLWTLLILLPVAVILFILSNFMTRRSHHGVETVAHCEALKRWLKDFSALDERPPMDIKVWGEFMVYAFLFGVADKVIAELKETVPDLFNGGESFASDPTFVPWWIWYSSASTGPMGAASFSDAFSGAMNNTASIASEAISAASGNFSSGDGFGGGFSGGGGGGFGGGGGAR